MGNRGNGIINNNSVRRALVEKWKDADGEVRCVSCGSNENIEWHHPIPIEVGGQDVITNLVPACHTCHMAAHSWKEIRREKMTNRAPNLKGGRKIEVPENYKELLKEFVFCEIGKIELGRKWNEAMGKDTDKAPDAVTHLTDKRWYHAYLKELGIAKVHNGIDAHVSKKHPNKHTIKDGTVIGTITYIDGKVESIVSKSPEPTEAVEEPKKYQRPKGICLPENYKALLNDFIFCRIGFKELLSKWDVDPQSPASLVEYKRKQWYKDYLNELGIEYCTNKIDKPTQAYLNKGLLGFVKYQNGKTVDIYEKSTQTA